MLREYPEPKDFESFLYVSQVLQAEGIKSAPSICGASCRTTWVTFLATQRLLAVCFVSSIDYTGRWKALQYYARRFYSEILVSPHEENGNINVFVVSDRLQPALRS